LKGEAVNNKLTAITLLVICSQVFGPVCSKSEGGSIWAKRDKSTKLIYADDKACQVGDILTVIISETSNIKNEIERELTNESSRTIAFNPQTELNDEPFSWLPRIPGVTESFTASASKSLDGESDYEDKRTYTDRMTVVVQDIHPNGNLVVLGSRHRDVAGDKVTIQVSGIVRPRDILFDNTILSEQVADFKIVTVNKGVTENYTKPGWLASIFDALWPF
jgi:flagellar L-ring protein precursor FlgH